MHSMPCIVAGLWSLIKRSPKAKIKRKTFEVEGPVVVSELPRQGAMVRRGWPNLVVVVLQACAKPCA